MIESVGLATFLDIIKNNDFSNEQVENIYRSFLKYDSDFKNFDFLIATNDLKDSGFSTTCLSDLNHNIFLDQNSKTISVSHPFQEYKNLIYLSEVPKREIKIDSSIFVDSNSMDIFNRHHIVENNNELISFIVQNNLDINYLPYILEDYVNKEHENPKIEKTKQRVHEFEIISHLDKQYYKKHQKISIDNDLLKKYGYIELEELVRDRFYYFTHFFPKNYSKDVNCPNSVVMHLPTNKDYHFDINYFIADYNFIYLFILQIVLDKRIAKKSSTSIKIKNLYLLMAKTGRIYKQILHLAYNYYENQTLVDSFMVFDLRGNSDKTLHKAHNISWDIFLYTTSNLMMQTSGNHKEINYDFHLPFFLTQDNKFYKSFVSPYKQKIIVFDKSKAKGKQRPFYGVSSVSKADIVIDKIIESLHKKSFINRDKYYKLNENINKRLSISLLLKEQLERQINKVFT